MSIFYAIRAQNERTLQLLRKLEDTTVGEPEERSRLLEELRAHIEALDRAAEDELYPLLVTEPELHDDAVVAREQKHETEDILRDLRGIDPTHPDFGRTVELLHGHVRQQIIHEEQILFPEAERTLPSEQSDDLGNRLEARKLQLMGEGRPSGAAP